MLHDVCDHKYTASISKASLAEFIFSELPAEKAKVVIDIINNISFSQEVNDKRVTLAAPYDIYQNIVSDADKLEALGQVGLDRCIIYTKSKGGAVPEDVIKHCHEKLLLLKDNFIKTHTGKQMATDRHVVIKEFVDANA
jgi:uncharacterized protein